MKNKDVVLAFLKKEEAWGSHLYSTGKRLISYNTSIAEWYGDCYLLVNHTRYSNSTSKHQSYLRGELINNSNIVEFCLNDIDKNTHDLISIYSSNKRRINEILY